MSSHIVLTSHPLGRTAGQSPPLHWGAATAAERGPVVASLTNPAQRNAIGTHSGAYALYRALAVASGRLDRDHRPDLTDTSPAEVIGPHPQWADPDKIVSLDPWGHMVATAFAAELAAGIDLRPTIAVTKARINMPELKDAVAAGRLVPDGTILHDNGDVRVTKAAIDPVWHLPGIARRFDVAEGQLRRVLFEQTGGMFPGARHAARSPRVPAADRRHDALFLRRRRRAGPRRDQGRLPRARRMQRLGRVRLRHLHLPALSRAWRRGLHRDGAAGRRGSRRLQPQGRPRARRGDEIPRLQRAQAPGGRRSRGDVFRAHRMRGRRAGHAVPGADARRLPLARHRADRPLGVDEQHEARRAHGPGHRRRRAGARFRTTSFPPTRAWKWMPRRPPATTRRRARRAGRRVAKGRALDE